MTERPLTGTLYCPSMNCASSRCVGEAGLRKPSQQRIREQCLHAHLRTYTQPTQLLLLEQAFSPLPEPALRTGLMARAWRPTLCTWGVILDLTLINKMASMAPSGLVLAHHGRSVYCYYKLLEKLFKAGSTMWLPRLALCEKKRVIGIDFGLQK